MVAIIVGAMVAIIVEAIAAKIVGAIKANIIGNIVEAIAAKIVGVIVASRSSSCLLCDLERRFTLSPPQSPSHKQNTFELPPMPTVLAASCKQQQQLQKE
ncbi:hypothetical protein Pcinc_043832 [Petrolisthes cinctipes]|uniref:Uncharacterized protein n=1 Tax=Petrolisthes cinctipes TaxID=88211 RepID=A0AAE1EHH9_PETCI|nr:hypothetical protein Pcinc_043832 [Petrolisthes cinctipes]